MFSAIDGILDRLPDDDTPAAGVGAFVNADAVVADDDTLGYIKHAEPQLFCESYQTPGGGVVFSEPTEPDRWISAAQTMEVEP